MLKQEKRSRIIGKYGEIEVHEIIKQTLSKDFISKEVIEEKIKILEMEEHYDCIDNKKIVKILQELLEEK